MENLHRMLKFLNKNQRAIEALRSICERFPVETIVESMTRDGVFNQKDVEIIWFSADKVEALGVALIKAEREQKIQLLRFEWVLLPEVFVKVEILTDAGMRVFSGGQ